MLDFSQMPRFKEFESKILFMISSWSTCFQAPPEQIERQIPIAHAWCDHNPRKAFKKDPVRFLFNWLKIADRKGTLQHHRSFVYQEQRPPESEQLTYEDIQAMKGSR